MTIKRWQTGPAKTVSKLNEMTTQINTLTPDSKSSRAYAAPDTVARFRMGQITTGLDEGSPTFVGTFYDGVGDNTTPAETSEWSGIEIKATLWDQEHHDKVVEGVQFLAYKDKWNDWVCVSLFDGDPQSSSSSSQSSVSSRESSRSSEATSTSSSEGADSASSKSAESSISSAQSSLSSLLEEGLSSTSSSEADDSSSSSSRESSSSSSRESSSSSSRESSSSSSRKSSSSSSRGSEISSNCIEDDFGIYCYRLYYYEADDCSGTHIGTSTFEFCDNFQECPLPTYCDGLGTKYKDLTFGPMPDCGDCILD